jgi:hypothetical protein
MSGDDVIKKLVDAKRHLMEQQALQAEMDRNKRYKDMKRAEFEMENQTGAKIRLKSDPSRISDKGFYNTDLDQTATAKWMKLKQIFEDGEK